MVMIDAAVMQSRFFRPDDPRVDVVAGVRLPAHWWSRPYEYAWAAGFAEKGQFVLDAGCGVPHPFKFMLSERGCYVTGQDKDERICDIHAMAAECEREFGTLPASLAACVARARRYPNIAEIAGIPFRTAPWNITLPWTGKGVFDRIFCLSVLEHMDSADRAKALAEFARVLAPGGLVLITCDCPPVTPSALLGDARAAGLAPCGAVSVDMEHLLGGPCAIFRCALKHEVATCES